MDITYILACKRPDRRTYFFLRFYRFENFGCVSKTKIEAIKFSFEAQKLISYFSKKLKIFLSFPVSISLVRKTINVYSFSFPPFYSINSRLPTVINIPNNLRVTTSIKKLWKFWSSYFVRTKKSRTRAVQKILKEQEETNKSIIGHTRVVRLQW